MTFYQYPCYIASFCTRPIRSDSAFYQAEVLKWSNGLRILYLLKKGVLYRIHFIWIYEYYTEIVVKYNVMLK